MIRRPPMAGFCWMPDVLLATANARYSHSAFGLRCLWANLGAYQAQTTLREFIITQSSELISEALLADAPAILGLGVYIWNVTLLTEVVARIRAKAPEILIILGGPEISHEYENTPLFAQADYLIRGEGEIAFRQLIAALLDGERPPEKVIDAPPPDPASLVSPYTAYTDSDIAHRVLYVEASRGCPFHCAFCLSARDHTVREFPLDPFLYEMESLLARGARQFKFVDRTFNLRADRIGQVLDFFQARWQDGMVLHFEIVPDRLNERILHRMAEFPAGGLHLEAGIQSLHPEALHNIHRQQDNARALEHLRFLREKTGANLHVDLVVGLPGETLETLADGFDHLIALTPPEFQVGILKRLRGAPLAEHADRFGLVFSPAPPYEILETPTFDRNTLQRLKRFARYLDLYYNAGNFPKSLLWLWKTHASPFTAFLSFSDFIWQTTGRTHELPLAKQAELLHAFLVERMPENRERIAREIETDFRRLPGRKDHLPFL